MFSEENNQNNNNNENENIDLSQFKIFPRNLTAYADYNVKGNPPISRPESGVDNDFPGLEFDHRNLERSFFPELIFEYHHNNGAKLVNIKDKFLFSESLNNNDLNQDGGLYLWALLTDKPSFTNDNLGKSPILFNNRSGMLVWRYIHDLLPGKIGILIKPGSPVEELNESEKADLIETYNSDDNIKVRRNEEGFLQYAVIVSTRAKYLDENGVIDVASYEPGDLTKSLCSPWQYDFRECACFYWAASKPDLVASSDGINQNLNFLRKNRNADNFPDRPDLNWYGSEEMDHTDLISDGWKKLPVVIDDKEDENEVSET